MIQQIFGARILSHHLLGFQSLGSQPYGWRSHSVSSMCAGTSQQQTLVWEIFKTLIKNLFELKYCLSGLLVEHITPSPFVLADGLISLTMAKGQRYEV